MQLVHLGRCRLEGGPRALEQLHRLDEALVRLPGAEALLQGTSRAASRERRFDETRTAFVLSNLSVCDA